MSGVDENLPDKSMDMVVTSPPYDNLRTYNNSLVWDFNIFSKIAKELSRILKEGGVIVWVVGDATIKGSETGTSFRQALYFKDCGLNLHDTMIYAKNSYMPLTHNRYEQQFEYMFVFCKGKLKTFNPIMIPTITGGSTRDRSKTKIKNDKKYAERCRDEITTVKLTKQAPNIFWYNVGTNDKTRHPAPFPIELVNDHILSWSNENDTILDPSSGSGTTAIACINTNRNFICMEKEEKYYNLSVERVGKYIKKDGQDEA